jgi:hypothetical protein
MGELMMETMARDEAEGVQGTRQLRIGMYSASALESAAHKEKRLGDKGQG